MLHAALCLLALAAPPELTLPKEVVGEPGAFVRVKAATTGKTVKWLALDAGLNVFPTDLLKDTRTAVVTAGRAGRYRLLAVTAAADELSDPAVCVVVIGDAPPPGPGPGPGPDPPPPTDPLARAVQAAYAAETESDRATSVKSLAALYRQGVEVLPKVDTVGALFKTLQTAAATLKVAGKVVGVQKVIQGELRAALPTAASTKLTPELRARAADVFGKVAKALESVRPASRRTSLLPNFTREVARGR